MSRLSKVLAIALILALASLLTGRFANAAASYEDEVKQYFGARMALLQQGDTHEPLAYIYILAMAHTRNHFLPPKPSDLLKKNFNRIQEEILLSEPSMRAMLADDVTADVKIGYYKSFNSIEGRKLALAIIAQTFTRPDQYSDYIDFLILLTADTVKNIKDNIFSIQDQRDEEDVLMKDMEDVVFPVLGASFHQDFAVIYTDMATHLGDLNNRHLRGVQVNDVVAMLLRGRKTSIWKHFLPCKLFFLDQRRR